MQQQLKVDVSSYKTEWSNGKQAVFYVIECSMGDKEWEVQHRYSEFNSLQISLKANHGALPSLPGKTLFPPKKPDQIEKRRLYLKTYIQQIVERLDVYSNDAFIEFFKLNEKQPNVKGNQLGMIGRVTHSLMGYRDIIILDQKRLFFSVTSDMSAISR